jgi:hypothetical protein
MTEKIQQESESRTEIFTDLVISMLSVNNWPLEKVAVLLPKLKEGQLLDPDIVSLLSFEEAVRRLKEAGYTRGQLVVNILAERLIRSATAFIELDLQAKLEQAELLKQPKEAKELLMQLYGVGPRVVENYILLRGFS